MDADYKKRILKELELFPLWKLKDKPNDELLAKETAKFIEANLFFGFKINYAEAVSYTHLTLPTILRV